MNRHGKLMLLLVLAVTLVLLTACRSSNPQDEETRIETRVAEELAIAATLTASAEAATADTATPTPEPTTVPADTPVVATEEPTAAADTNDEATSAPTDTPVVLDAQPPATPPPAPTPVVLAFLPVDGNDGNDHLRSSFDENSGRVVLFPGFAQGEISAPVVFQDRIVMQIEVFDTRVGLTDGAGIEQVTFTIEDELDGRVLYSHTEKTPGYCIFGGGEPDCNVLDLEEANYRWSDEEEIFSGEYLVRIDIDPENGEGTQWRVRFDIDAPGRERQTDEPEPEYDANAARINNITEADDRYMVDFEALGFEPTLPGQHVHFFWNTVPPEEAGQPGDGPWQLYPASPGEPGDSPFTLFRPYDRPEDATQICVLVANPDHSVIQGSGNCRDLPDGD